MWGGGVCQGSCRRDLKDYVRLREGAYGSGCGVLSASDSWAAASVLNGMSGLGSHHNGWLPDPRHFVSAFSLDGRPERSRSQVSATRRLGKWLHRRHNATPAKLSWLLPKLKEVSVPTSDKLGYLDRT